MPVLDIYKSQGDANVVATEATLTAPRHPLSHFPQTRD